MKKQWKIIGLGCMAAMLVCLWLSTMYISPATANICFLPSGKCGDAAVTSSGGEPDQTCSTSTYNLSSSLDCSTGTGRACTECKDKNGSHWECHCLSGWKPEGSGYSLKCYMDPDPCADYTETTDKGATNTAYRCTICSIQGSKNYGKYYCECTGEMKNGECVEDKCIGYDKTSCPKGWTKIPCPDDTNKMKCTCDISDGKQLKDDGTCEDIVNCISPLYEQNNCNSAKNGKSNPNHWMCEVVGNSECYMLSQKCDSSQKEYASKNDCLTDNPQYLCDKETTDGVCVIPGTNACQDGKNNKYSNKEKCERAFYPYKCKEEKTGGCWIKDDSKDCTSNAEYYNTEDDCRRANSGFGCLEDKASGCWYKSGCNEASGMFTTSEACQNAVQNIYICKLSGECYQLDQCNAAGNYFSSEEDCLKKTDYVCEEVIVENIPTSVNVGTCWKPNNTLCDESKHEYNSLEKCETVFGTGNCEQLENKCYASKDERCSEEKGQYPTIGKCEEVYGTGNCILDDIQCYIGKDGICDEDKGEYRLKADCERKFGENKCIKNTAGCYVSNDCPLEYSTEVQTALDCGDGSIGSLGWEVVTEGEVGGKACGKCVKIECPNGYTDNCSRIYACDLCVGYDEDNPGANKAYKGDAECKRYETVEGQQHAICNLLGTGYRMYSEGNVPEGWGKVQASGRETGCYCAKEGAICDETTEFAKLEDCEGKYGTDNCEQDEETKCYKEKASGCEEYPYVKASTGGAVAYGTTAWSTNGIIPYLKSTKSIYVAHNDHFEGDFNDEVFNMIATDANTCTDSNGVVHYDKICGGTPKAKCTESDVTTFSHNGCVSGTYTAHYDGSSYYKPSGSEWGSCSRDCSKRGSGYYNDLSECQEHITGDNVCKYDNSCYHIAEKGTITWTASLSDKVTDLGNGNYVSGGKGAGGTLRLDVNIKGITARPWRFKARMYLGVAVVEQQPYGIVCSTIGGGSYDYTGGYKDVVALSPVTLETRWCYTVVKCELLDGDNNDKVLDTVDNVQTESCSGTVYIEE